MGLDWQYAMQVMFLEMGKHVYVAATANRSLLTVWDLEPHSSLTRTFRPLLQVGLECYQAQPRGAAPHAGS